MEQEKNEVTRIMNSTEGNKREIIQEIEYRQELLNTAIKSCETLISKQMEISIKNDFYYEPQLSMYNEIVKWQEVLNMSKNVLENMRFTPEELMGESGECLEKADKVVELIDNNLNQKQNDFIRENTDLFIGGQTKKHQVEMKLKTLEMQTEGLRLLRKNNESKKNEVQLQVDNLKFKFWKRRERKKYMAEAVAYDEGDNHTVELINSLEQQIEQLNRELKQARYNHGGIDIQGRRIKVNYVNKSNSYNNTEQYEAEKNKTNKSNN